MSAFIGLDAQAAAHLYRALVTHSQWCRAQGLRLPDAVGELREAARDWARAGQDGSRLGDPGEWADAHPVPPLLLTLPQVAALLGGSLSSVKRLVAARALVAVDFAGVRRVRRADLERFVEALPPVGVPWPA